MFHLITNYTAVRSICQYDICHYFRYDTTLDTFTPEGTNFPHMTLRKKVNLRDSSVNPSVTITGLYMLTGALYSGIHFISPIDL